MKSPRLDIIVKRRGMQAGRGMAGALPKAEASAAVGAEGCGPARTAEDMAGRNMRFRGTHGDGDSYRYAFRRKKIGIDIQGRPPGIFTCTPNTLPGASEKTTSGVCHAPGSTA